MYRFAARSTFTTVTWSCVFPQPNVPCTDNVAFDMERLTRGQPASRRSALGDFGTDSSLSLEPLRTSGMSQLPQDGELTPRSGEINIAVTSKCPLAPSTVLRLPWCVCPSVLQGPGDGCPCRDKGDLSVSARGICSLLEPIALGMTVPTLPLLMVYPFRSACKEPWMN